MTAQNLSIAVVRPYLTTSKGGAERYALELTAAFAAAGHRVHVFAHSWDRPEHPGVAYTKISMPRKPAWLRVLRFHANLRRVLRPAEFDVVLGMTPFWPQHVFWLGDGLYRVWVQIAWPLAPVRRLMILKRAVMAVNLALEKKMLSAATRGFVVNSRLVAGQVRRLYGVRPERIAIVPPAIDERRFNPEVRALWRSVTRRRLGIGEEEVVLLFASHNFRRKGLGLLLETLAQIIPRAETLCLLVAGAGPVAAFRRRARKLGVADRIHFLGAVSDIERYYAAADGFVLPTLYDPCAAACLEAMACGLPVITTVMNGAAEFITEGESGFVLPAGAAPAALGPCLMKLLDRDWSTRAGQRAGERVRALSAAAHSERLCAALHSFARRDPAPVMMRLAPDLMVNEAFLPLLRTRQLAGFSALFAAAERHELEYNRNKRIALLALADQTGSRRFFVKSHRQGRSRLGFRATEDAAGTTELRNILALRNAGIPTVEPVAAGERALSDGSRESLVMTVCLDGYLPADRYISERFAPPLSAERRREKNALGRTIAAVAARMHAGGFHHRDLYLCHIFVRADAPGEPEIKLIDLQRVGHHRFAQRRWAIKDLAQLHYSSLELPISERDRLRFFARYCPAAASKKQRLRMLRRVLRKSRLIARHDAKLRAGAPAPRDPFTLSGVLTPDAAPRHDEHR